jgi:hypothetical protein
MRIRYTIARKDPRKAPAAATHAPRSHRWTGDADHFDRKFARRLTQTSVDTMGAAWYANRRSSSAVREVES